MKGERHRLSPLSLQFPQLMPDLFTKRVTKWIYAFTQFPCLIQFSNCSANLTISNPIRTSNCKFETTKNLKLTCTHLGHILQFIDYSQKNKIKTGLYLKTWLQKQVNNIIVIFQKADFIIPLLCNYNFVQKEVNSKNLPNLNFK